MKVLVYQNIPVKIRSSLSLHQAFTARERHWDWLRNGELLKAAETDQLGGLLTADQSIFYQQNNLLRTIALVVLSTNDWEILRWHIEPINEAIQRSRPRSFELLRLARPASNQRK